jgi:hypothetical protein
MYNKEQAKMLSPVVNSKEWNNLVEYLNSLKELTVKGLVTAQSESELRQLQGKLALLEMLLDLKNNHERITKNGSNRRTYSNS